MTNNLNPVPVDKGAVIRTVVLIVALVNQLLVSAGYSPLPFDDAGVELFVSSVFTVAVSLVTWWKNNSLTRKARMADKLAAQKGLK